MNDGIRAARGRFFAYLDDDNQWRKDYLAKMIGCLERCHDCALVYCDTCDHFSKDELFEKLTKDARTYTHRSPTAVVFPHLGLFTKLEFFASGRGYKDYIDTIPDVSTRKQSLRFAKSIRAGSSINLCLRGWTVAL